MKYESLDHYMRICDLDSDELTYQDECILSNPNLIAKLLKLRHDEYQSAVEEYMYLNEDRHSVVCDLNIPDSVTRIKKFAFYGAFVFYGAFHYNNYCMIEKITIPKGVTSIGVAAFCSCTGLDSITLPVGLKHIGDYAFSSCSHLEYIVIPESVESIGSHAFDNCRKLKGIKLPSTLRSIGDYTFSSCHDLKSINIPGSVESVGYHAFDKCSCLKEVTLHSTLINAAGYYDYAFIGCDNLVSIIAKA